MANTTIWMEIFLGIVVGFLMCFILLKLKKRSIRKNALKEIKEQRLKFRIDGKPVDIYGTVLKDQEKKEIEERKERKLKEEKTKKEKVKKERVTKKKKETKKNKKGAKK